jgi:hypothetical protein
VHTAADEHGSANTSSKPDAEERETVGVKIPLQSASLSQEYQAASGSGADVGILTGNVKRRLQLNESGVGGKASQSAAGRKLIEEL